MLSSASSVPEVQIIDGSRATLNTRRLGPADGVRNGAKWGAISGHKEDAALDHRLAPAMNAIISAARTKQQTMV